MDLFTQLAEILCDGHKLKKLNIHFEDEQLTTHTIGCWNSVIKCDFRDHIQEAFGHLRHIRGVDCVTITGIPATFAHELKLRIQSKPKSFLDLPGELRNEIYSYCGDYSDISASVALTMKKWTDKTQPPPYPKRSTPNVLLLNKQIHGEASHYFRIKTLDLVLP